MIFITVYNIQGLIRSLFVIDSDLGRGGGENFFYICNQFLLINRRKIVLINAPGLKTMFSFSLHMPKIYLIISFKCIYKNV